MIDGVKLRRSIGTALSVILSLEVVGSWLSFSEACNDGYEFQYGMAALNQWLIVVAPMDLSLLVVPLLVGVLTWLRSRIEVPTGVTLIFMTGIAVMGWLCLGMFLQMYKSVMDLNGHREPTASMWIANAGVTVVLLLAIAREWRKGKVIAKT